MEISRVCPICGEVFQTTTNRLKHGRGKTCSKKCQYQLRRLKNDKIKFKCAVCGKKIWRSKSQVTSKYQFCSRDCSYKGRSLGYVERTITKPYNTVKSLEEEKQCLLCHTNFFTRKTKQKYCTRHCFEQSHKERMRGSNNPSYIDGRSKNTRCYRGDDWKDIRKKIYERDQWTCQDCGKHCEGREIQCHHIIPYKETQDNSEDNLVTLCVSCHGKYGGKKPKLFSRTVS